MSKDIKTAVFGASGYVGAELIRILSGHPDFLVTGLAAERRAGETYGEVFPQMRHLDLPKLKRIKEFDLSEFDMIFAALPHGVTQKLAKALPNETKLVDCSADFRFRDPADYKKWYGLDHAAVETQPSVAYGLPEFYREQIASAQITANTGCYVATALLPLIPILERQLIDPSRIVIDAASGVTGAGRGAKEALLYTEVTDGFHAYGVGHHRHMGELDQELSKAAGMPVTPSFTPHLLPQSRGILATIYVDGEAEAIHAVLASRYRQEPFVDVLGFKETPATRHVRGSNLCRIGVAPDRIKGRTIITSALDNLVKGASGQAIQNANIMLNLGETTGLPMGPVFP
ncbi:MAG: N-acetyl-gamma-glutamyl-phosphate reductase [Pseudomonadota bacterium]